MSSISLAFSSSLEKRGIVSVTVSCLIGKVLSTAPMKASFNSSNLGASFVCLGLKLSSIVFIKVPKTLSFSSGVKALALSFILNCSASLSESSL